MKKLNLTTAFLISIFLIGIVSSVGLGIRSRDVSPKLLSDAQEFGMEDYTINITPRDGVYDALVFKEICEDIEVCIEGDNKLQANPEICEMKTICKPESARRQGFKTEQEARDWADEKWDDLIEYKAREKVIGDVITEPVNLE